MNTGCEDIISNQPKTGESLPKLAMKNLLHLMLDLETMGKQSNSVICSIGAVEFDIKTGNTGREFYRRIDINSCLDIGLTVDGSTIEWWLNQNEKARKAISTGKSLSITQALLEFTDFVETIGGKYLQIWGNAARFDLGILEDAYCAIKINIPWDFRLERDVRTLVSFAPKVREHYPNLGMEHNPIDDCKYQIGYCSAIWQKLNSV